MWCPGIICDLATPLLTYIFVDSAHTLWKHYMCLAFTTLVSIRSVCFLFGVITTLCIGLC